MKARILVVDDEEVMLQTLRYNLERERYEVLTAADGREAVERVWGIDYDGDGRTLDVHIHWLREKIEDDPASPRIIVTVRGVGYRFDG